VRRILEADFSDFVQNLEEKGVQIFQNNVTIGMYEKVAVAKGTLITDENNAVVRVEEEATPQEIQEEEPSG